MIRAATVMDATGERTDGWVLIDGPTIAAVGEGEGTPAADEVLDLGDACLVPGFVDLHNHGGGGVEFGTADPHAALAAHRARGTTRLVASLVTQRLDVLERQLRELAAHTGRHSGLLGSHLEGPFLAPSRRGAHAAQFLRNPDPQSVDRLIQAADGTLRLVTIAPELPGAIDAIRRFVDAGVVVAIGHTEAGAAEAEAAFDAGATLVTHAFNAMPGIHHRAPGPVTAALRDPRVCLELIADGHHVDSAVMALTHALAPGRVALVSDAMAAAGGSDGHYRLGAIDVEVSGGRALVAGQETLAGSTLTLDQALRRSTSEVGLSRLAAVTALTWTPARALRADDEIGSLQIGRAADLVALDGDGLVTDVWMNGVALETLRSEPPRQPGSS